MIYGIIIGILATLAAIIFLCYIATHKRSNNRIIRHRCHHCNEGEMEPIFEPAPFRLSYYQCDECFAAYKKVCSDCHEGFLEYIDAPEPFSTEHYQCTKCDSTFNKEET